MFPSNSNNDNYEPISYTLDQEIFHKSFFSDYNNQNSKQEDPPFSFFNLPSPLFPYEEDDAFLLQHHESLLFQQTMRVPDITVAAETFANMVDSKKIDTSGPTSDCKKKSHSVTEQIPRRRSSKKDRHSKINTARGPRDRRMRLSLEVARKFFHLQDMLGYDKASRTVEWLLRQSESAIKEIARGLGLSLMNRSCSDGTKSASSTSDCEVVSGIDEVGINQDRQRSLSKGKSSACVTKEKKMRQLRKAAFNPVAREKREEARARARERTRKKMWSRRLDESKLSDEAANHESNQLSSSSPFEAGEESGTQSHNMNHSLEILAEADQEPSTHKLGELSGTTEGMVDDSLLIMGKWSPSSIYNYLHNTGIPQEHQFAELPILWQTMGGLQQYS